MNDKRVAWIEVVSEADAEGELAELYAEERQKAGVVDHILQVHSLHPRSLRDHLRLYQTTLHGPSGLSRAERETLAVVVSAINRCHY